MEFSASGAICALPGAPNITFTLPQGFLLTHRDVRDDMAWENCNFVIDVLLPVWCSWNKWALLQRLRKPNSLRWCLATEVLMRIYLNYHTVRYLPLVQNVHQRSDPLFFFLIGRNSLWKSLMMYRYCESVVLTKSQFSQMLVRLKELYVHAINQSTTPSWWRAQHYLHFISLLLCSFLLDHFDALA